MISGEQVTADTILAQAGLTKVRQAGQPARTIVIESVVAGVGEFSGTATATYVA
jgi:hypothetical protein